MRTIIPKLFGATSGGYRLKTDVWRSLDGPRKDRGAKFQFQLVTEMEPGNAGAWQQLLNLALKGEDIPEVIRICTACMELSPSRRNITSIWVSLTTNNRNIKKP